MALRMLNRFSGANARFLSLRTDGPEPELTFAPDPHGGPEALWFRLRVDDPAPPAKPPASFLLTLRFFGNLLGADDPTAVRPVTHAPGKGWFRLKPPTVETHPDGQQSLTWSLPYPAVAVEIALCHPYDRDDLTLLLEHNKGYWLEEGIGLTQEGRVLTRLRNAVQEGGAACPHPRGLYVVARQHSGETPGSWVLDGLLTALARAKPVQWCVWAVPFAHLDGVAAGDYGKDPFPYDLNRAWGVPPMRHETLVMQCDMRRWAARCKPELVLDLHAPGACETSGVYAYLAKEGSSEWERAARAWTNVFRQALSPDYADEDFARHANHASRWETARIVDFARDGLNCPAMSLETPYALCRGTLMHPKQYREVGQRLARAILTRHA